MGKVSMGKGSVTDRYGDTVKVIVSAVKGTDAVTIAKYEAMRENRELPYEDIELAEINPRAEKNMWNVTLKIGGGGG